MAGTPAVTTDWGAFTETVPHEFRFRTLQQGVDALERAADADNAAIREYALGRYSLEAVAPMFDEWFEALAELRGEGWYSRRSPQRPVRSLQEVA